MASKPLKNYMEELAKYMEAFTSAAGKPQQLTIVGDRVYWTQGKQQELFAAPVGASAAAATRVIAPDSAAAVEGKLTKEEEMLRERTRSQTTGIKSFHVRQSDSAVFYTSGVDVYVYYQQGPRAGKAPLKMFNYMSAKDKAHFEAMGGKPNLFVQPINSFDPAHPSDHTVMTFVNNNNVYMATLTETPSSEEAPLSLAVKQITHIGDALHQCGEADYMIQEEFVRYTGHYATDRYVVFSYIDSTSIRSVALLKSLGSPEIPESEPTGPWYEAEVEDMPYSRVGDPNASTTLVVYDVATQQLRLLPDAAIRKVAPWTEYLLRFGFKNADTLYVSVVSRAQEDYAVMTCPIAALPVIEQEEDLRKLYDSADTVANITGDAALPEMHVEWQQHIDFAWVECQPQQPIEYGSKYDVLCRHADETPTAHYHLYARAASDATSSPAAWRPLTAGAWNVVPSSQRVCDDRIYFLANAEQRLTRAIYSAPLSLEAAPYTADTITRLTPLDEHVYSFSVKGGHLYYVASSPAAPAKLYASRVSAPSERTEVAVPAWIAAAPGTSAAAAAADPTKFFAGLPVVAPHVVTVTSRRGVPLSAAVFASPTAPTNAPGPLAIFVYGGPHVQLVFANDYDVRLKAPVQVLLQHGISVAVVDNQMSSANGLRDLSVCKKNMGSFETDDYVDVTRHLCNTPAAELGMPSSFQIDAKRVAIFGWSYGGYATLLAMCQAADVFRMGFAGAPVGDWKLYDTGYTERYMGTLYEHDSAAGAGAARKRNEAYMTSTIGHYASGFPEECNRLYIAHGLLDENVHFSHSCHVVKALIDNAKPYCMLVYPGERHGLRQNRQSRLHHDALLVKTLEEQL